MTHMPDALHRLAGSVTDTYTVTAEHPSPRDIRPSICDVSGGAFSMPTAGRPSPSKDLTWT